MLLIIIIIAIVGISAAINKGFKGIEKKNSREYSF